MAEKMIFIVEDDPDINELMCMALENKGFATKAFSDSRTVGGAAVGLRPDLIIMDVWMPEQDGISVAKKLKSKKETRKIPILLVSATNDLLKKTKKVGADGYLHKPFDIKELVRIVKKLA